MLRLRLTCCLLTALCLLAAPPPPLAAQGGTFYVAPDGGDAPGGGSAGAPWATISYAITRVPDGSTILVRPGEYRGLVRLDASFAEGVTVRSEVPYQARLRNTERVVISYNGQGITLEGFDIAHSGPGAGALVVHIQNLRTQGATSRITLRNNILHDSYNNDILKINNGARDILVTGNIFYNQTGSDEHIDVNSVTGVTVEDNIFFNDYAGSGRADPGGTSAFVVVKDSNGNDDGLLGSRDITLRRNIFLGWVGSVGHGFIQIGEDATANYEADGVLVENNLMLGNSPARMRSSLAVMGSRNVTVRNNTVAGDLPSSSFAMRLYAIAPNQPNSDIRFYNNVWSDPSGTMTVFAEAPGGQTASFALSTNLYWNGGQPLPSSAASLVNITGDAARVVGDPLLGSQAGIVLPRAGASGLADGSATVREAFEGLVARYGTPGAGSPAIDRARPDQAPAEDILGNPRPRGSAPDVGAVEVQQGAPPPTLGRALFLPLIRR